jgi:hypothetical protein
MTVGPARFCYIVLCHTDAEAVLRLARRIRSLSPAGTVLLRHDRKDFITPAMAGEAGAELLRSGIPVRWGSPSMVDAMIEALRYAGDIVDPDYCAFISGHDYPIRDLGTWELEVADSGADVLLGQVGRVPPREDYAYVWSLHSLPAGIPRLVRRGSAYVWGRVAARVRWAVVARAAPDGRWFLGRRRISLLWREPPVPLVKAPQWITLSRHARRRLLDRHDTDPATRRFLRTMKVPDETYLQSVLAADLEVRIREGLTNFVRWGNEEASSPEWLTEADLSEAMESGAAFARKVRPDATALIAGADALCAAS